MWQEHATEAEVALLFQTRVELKHTCKHLLTIIEWLRKMVVSKVATRKLILMVSIEGISNRTLELLKV